jgi:hypothetical protein
MGVDISALFGIGAKVIGFKKEYNDEEISFEENLDNLLEESIYAYDKIGDENYSGDPDEYYIDILNPFKDGFNITEKVKKLKLFCEEKGIEIEEIGLYGGLYKY